MSLPIKTVKFTVKEAGRSMDVVVPLSNDKSYDNYVIESEKEKTKEQLRNMPPPKPINMGAREKLGEGLREYKEYQRRKSENTRKWY